MKKLPFSVLIRNSDSSDSFNLAPSKNICIPIDINKHFISLVVSLNLGLDTILRNALDPLQ